MRTFAHYESLTGLPNRALLTDRLNHAIARADRSGSLLAVMILDLDNFKEINDALGQAVGDLVLTEAARRLQSCLRSMDTLARLGDDEFAVLLEGVPDCRAKSRSRLRSACSQAVAGARPRSRAMSSTSRRASAWRSSPVDGTRRPTRCCATGQPRHAQRQARRAQQLSSASRTTSATRTGGTRS